ncbi:MAG: hypothetical protein GU356_01125 [Pyrobaculum sp.]|jgi:hypothetical protein|nr:hypothetical protein [Pyrobaculum sp.]
MWMWRRRREAASASLSAALYSVYHGLYSEAVVSSVASAVALAEVDRFREAVEYVQKAAKTLYEAVKEVFERVKVSLQRLAELFVEAVARVLALVDENKAYLFLMAAVSAGAVALSAALNLWGLVELEKLAYAAALTPFVAAGVEKYSREEVFNILRSASDPYEKFREIAKAANAGGIKLAEPWESLRVLIMPKPSEERRLMKGKAYRELDEKKKKALIYVTLALEEAFGVYKSALREYAVKKAVEKREVGEGPFKRVMYMPDLRLLTQLAEKEEAAFEKALSTLRKRLNEYAVKYDLRDLLNVEEGKARELAEAENKELSEFSGVNFGVKALAALIAYREYALGRRGAFGVAAWHWLEVDGSVWLLYYAPSTAHREAEKTGVERPVTVEEMVAEAFRRLFLKPGADHYSHFIEELTKGGKPALMPEGENESSYVFKLYNMKESGRLVDLGIEMRISKVKKSIVYILEFNVERWRGFFEQWLEVVEKAAEEVKGRLPVEDSLLYMLGWVDSDVAITRKKEGERVLRMTTSYLWQFAETHALFDWSRVVEFRMSLTLEGPKLQVVVGAPLKNLDDAIRRSAESGWLKILGVKAGLEDLMHVKSWDGLKQWVAGRWDVVVDAAVSRLGEEIWSVLEALRDRLNNDKVAREVGAPALLLIQAEKLGVNETTLRYFAAVISGAIGGDGYMSSKRRVVGLTSGEREIALLWVAALAAYGIKAEVRRVGSVFHVVVSGGDAARLASLYFRYGSPLLEGGDDRLKSHKLAEAVKLGAERLSVSWEGLRRTPSGFVAADLTISEGGAAVKYNVYLRNDKFELKFGSSDRGRVELAARLLRLAGVGAEVENEGSKDIWRIVATTDKLAAGHEKLRGALVEIVREAIARGWVDAGRAEGWLKKLKEGLTLKEGWPKYGIRLTRSGTLEVKYTSTNLESIEQGARRFREMGLVEDVHFSVKMPKGGKNGYVYILRKGLAYAAWLSVYGSGRQRELADEFISYILERAQKEGNDVYEKIKEVVDEGRARGSLRLEGFEKNVEVNGKTYVVKVMGGGAELEEVGGGKKLLRIRITAEVNGVRREYTITFGRYGKNRAIGQAAARADAPGGREADVKRFSALVEALTGKRPRIRRRSDGKIYIVCGREHLKGFMRYTELAETITRWLEETGRRT